MRCVCGFGDVPENVRYARIEHGELQCPYCMGRIACETASPPGLRCSAEAYAMLAPTMRRRKQETFWVFYVDARNRLIGKGKAICQGTLTTCIVHPREVFRFACVRRAVAVILAHNHPSGDPTPSPEDERLTHQLVEAGKMMGIPVLDHLVIGGDRYVSFRDEGRLG